MSLAQRGFRVFPLVINGKTPALQADWRKLATTDPDKIRRLWTDPVFESEIDFNIGIALDQNTLVVDVDVRDGKVGAQSLFEIEIQHGELPDTLVTETASGGKHYWFHIPDGNSGAFPKQLAPHIDLKGEGGYIVGPGSTIDGRNYRSRMGLASGSEIPESMGQSLREAGLRGEQPEGVAERCHLATLPDWTRALVRPGAGTNRHNKNRPGTCATLVEDDSEPNRQRVADWLVNHAPVALEGEGGDNTTIQVTNHCGDLGLTEQATFEMMAEQWNPTKAIPSWDDDELRQKVSNAYKSRQNPIGIRHPELEFDAVEVTDRRRVAPAPRGLYWIGWENAKPNLDRPYLIDDVLDAGTLAVMYGDSNTGKSYVALDQCVAVARGTDWNGHKVTAGAVLYLAPEGGTGFQKRIQAYRIKHRLEALPFGLVPCPIDLFGERADTRRIIELVREVEQQYEMPCRLIVVDTLARAMAAGDENTAVDMGKFVGHCDRLRTATGATVLVIHHTGKDKAKGARGSSALRAATDTEIEVGGGKVTATKQRDMPKGDTMLFDLESLPIGQRGDGKQVTACVVRWIVASEFEVRISPNAEQFLGVLERLIAARQDELDDSGEADSIPTVPWKTWKMSALSAKRLSEGQLSVQCTKDPSDTYWYELRRELLSCGLVEEIKKSQWVRTNTKLTKPD